MSSQIEVSAYYFPQFHPDPRSDAWHGKGWTEWDLVKAAKPSFPGHDQPIVPSCGYFDESDPEWAARESYLLPTKAHGTAYLEAIRDVFR